MKLTVYKAPFLLKVEIRMKSRYFFNAAHSLEVVFISKGNIRFLR